MTDTEQQRARRRAHNANALERCNAMGRTAGSILWQPLENRAGKWFMPDGSQLSEPPIEWRSERLSTILDEMDAIQAVAAVADPGKTYVETLDVEKWKAETGAQFVEGAARLNTASPTEVYDKFVWHDQAILQADYEALPRPPSTISLEELEKAISNPEIIAVRDKTWKDMPK